MPQCRHQIVRREYTQRCIAFQNLAVCSAVVLWLKFTLREARLQSITSGFSVRARGWARYAFHCGLGEARFRFAPCVRTVFCLWIRTNSRHLPQAPSIARCLNEKKLRTPKIVQYRRHCANCYEQAQGAIGWFQK
jgi:hypothetical protein